MDPKEDSVLVGGRAKTKLSSGISKPITPPCFLFLATHAGLEGRGASPGCSLLSASLLIWPKCPSSKDPWTSLTSPLNSWPRLESPPTRVLNESDRRALVSLRPPWTRQWPDGQMRPGMVGRKAQAYGTESVLRNWRTMRRGGCRSEREAWTSSGWGRTCKEGLCFHFHLGNAPWIHGQPGFGSPNWNTWSNISWFLQWDVRFKIGTSLENPIPPVVFRWVCGWVQLHARAPLNHRRLGPRKEAPLEKR